jgi:hypothetical protein
LANEGRALKELIKINILTNITNIGGKALKELIKSII